MSEEFPNLRGPDGHIGTPMPARSQGDVYCNVCGGSGSTGTMDVYDTEKDQWEYGVACFNHNPVAH